MSNQRDIPMPSPPFGFATDLEPTQRCQRRRRGAWMGWRRRFRSSTARSAVARGRAVATPGDGSAAHDGAGAASAREQRAIRRALVATDTAATARAVELAGR